MYPSTGDNRNCYTIILQILRGPIPVSQGVASDTVAFEHTIYIYRATRAHGFLYGLRFFMYSTWLSCLLNTPEIFSCWFPRRRVESLLNWSWPIASSWDEIHTKVVWLVLICEHFVQFELVLCSHLLNALYMEIAGCVSFGNKRDM